MARPVVLHDRGTPQTRKRLKRESTLDRLIRERRKQGHNDTADIERAAYEIERVYFAITRGLSIRTSSFEKVDRSEPAPAPPQLQTAYTKRYLPWAQLMDKDMDGPALKIIIDVVVFNRTLKDIDRRHRMRNGYARQVTIAGLKLYADLSQWG